MCFFIKLMKFWKKYFIFVHLKLDVKYGKKAGFNFTIYFKNLLKTIHMERLQSQFQNVNKKVKENVDETHWTSIHKLILFAVWQKICLYIHVYI